MRAVRKSLLVSLSALALALSACGGGDNTLDQPAGGGGGGGEAAKGEVIVGSADFGESELIGRMYAAVLDDAGYDVTEKFKVGSREVYLKALDSGELDVVPEYLATLTEALNAQINGPQAPTEAPLATSDPAETLSKLEPLLEQKKYVATPYSPAIDSNAFAVTQQTAEKYGLEKLSDLAKVPNQLVLGGPPECPTRPLCQPGLEKTYGAKFKSFQALDAGGPLTVGAIKEGQVDIGLVFSSDGVVAANDLVVLEDDKGLQPADNIIGIATAEAADEELIDLLDSVNQVLTTEDLQELNKRVGADKEDPADVATEYLQDKKLL